MKASWLYTLGTEYLGFTNGGELHKYLCQWICQPRKAQVRMVLVPRGFFKTSWFTYTHNTGMAIENPNVRILQCSGVMANAKIMVTKWGKTFTHNELFRDKYKEYCPKNPENPNTTWNSSAIYLPNRTTHHAEGTIEAFGADSTIVSRHYDYMKFDDIVTRENCTTRTQLEKIISFVKEAFGLCDHRMETPIDIIGTTWDDGDLYAHYLQMYKEELKEGRIPRTEIIKIPATYQLEAGNTIGMKLPFKEGESIFPERITTEELTQIQKDDPDTYAKFYNLDPIPIGDRTFNDFTTFDQLEGSDYRTFMTVDPAPTTNPTSSFSAINITKVDPKKNMYCVLSWRDKVTPDKLIDTLYKLYFDYECEKLGIETDVYQVALKYWLQERIRRDEKHRYMKIIELKARGKAKQDRIAALGPYVNAGQYQFKKSQSTLMYSLNRFPKAKDRDEADAAAYQLFLVKPSGITNVIEVNPKSLNAWKERVKRLRRPKRGVYVNG